MMQMVSRRRFITISAATAGFALSPLSPATTSDAEIVVWRGTMLGATATMKIHHSVRAEAERLISVACAEARRLEGLFSLYRSDSTLVELNRTGVLVDPAAELVDLLAISKRYARLTGGMFDPTVQPLWELYADHFSKTDADPSGPSQAAVETALARVGWDRLSVSRDRIAMPRGTRITLNGIAQGYVTDKVVELLRSQGITQSLVDMGETRAIGARPDGQPWEVGVADPEIVGQMQATLPIIDRAVSTSGAYGFRFDPTGRFNHLFNPATGACAHLYKSVTTVARSATAADALSTALSLMSEPRIRSLLPQLEIERVHLIDTAGVVSELVA
ncbi:FAD:protein FMN transferase [Bradyrhizobium sp. CCBAU 53338]|uniref:FAD:protein FMN transferase n=1 Tax=Bradyrhizobium sp. CCBAU 53338 TaxID=1325111 RepID=UPI00188B94D0|nr:FAD:protein FMN transferase [Bradyrhizobium sp. CCBAU 53338]QOZ55426.1 FAD:protein FMN transferase [Bradyrhizobium sp. CCBAU 53338]